MRLRLLAAAALLAATTMGARAEPTELLNVSYDPTREFYEEYNPLFIEHWKQTGGGEISVQQSHGGSGKQARSVIDGLQADVVTLALAYDIDAIAKARGIIANDWRSRFPGGSVPFYSTVVFLVRHDNPKQIKDWNDLTRDDVSVITPNPKTSGGARWNYLAAWAYALEKNGNDETKARNFLKSIFAHVPTLDTGARGSTTTFAQRGLGDVLITWETEALLALDQLGKDKFEIVYPSLSIRADTPVAVVDKVVEKKGTAKAATEYLNYLYSRPAQELAAKYHYRATDKTVAAALEGKFPSIKLITIDDLGGWDKVQATHFADGGVFDQIYGVK